MYSKQRIRKKFNLLRKKKYFAVSENFFKPLIKIIKLKRKKKISLYYPSNYEVDTLKLFNILNRQKKLSILLPKLINGKKMKFVKWNINDPLQINSFGFLEPVADRKSLKPDLAVVPLLAFDKFYNRLGYGKGYYDKFLSKYLNNKKKIITIGLAFSFQQYKKIPNIKSDVKLDYILTEKGFIN